MTLHAISQMALIVAAVVAVNVERRETLAPRALAARVAVVASTLMPLADPQSAPAAVEWMAVAARVCLGVAFGLAMTNKSA